MEILVGTAGGLHRLAGPVSVEPPGGEFRALHPAGPKWWALVGDRALYRSTDGIQWRLIAPIHEYPATCVHATPEAVYIGTEEAHLLRFGPGATNLVESFDRVKDRDRWYTPWGGPPATRSISHDWDGTLYVNVHVGGIPRSRDGGKRWKPTIDVDADVHQVVAHPSTAGLVFAATAYGLAVSTDGGDRWRFETDGLHGGYCRAVAVAGDALLLTASIGPRGGQAAVYRKPVGDSGPFERCRQGLPEWFGTNIDTHCLSAAGQTVAFGTDDGRVFVSDDAGATWEEVASGLPAVRCMSLAAS